MVPETLLKKRKSQEAARAERRAEADEKKKVSFFAPSCTALPSNYLMTTPTTRLDPRVNAVALLTIFRG